MTDQATIRIQTNPGGEPVQISRHLYGHFAEHLGRCVYEGLWVGEDSDIPHTRGIRDDVVAALRELKVPNLRWPGGCFADEYHWRDGIGPRDRRPITINSHWGGVVETNAFGTHEFLDLCDMLGCEPYLAANVGSGSVREMQDWVHYLTYDGDTTLTRLRKDNGRDEPWKIKYFGIGNENWGCGGTMRPEYYNDVYRQYAAFARNYSGNELYRVACGPNGRDLNWTRVLMQIAGHHMDGLALHYYTKEHRPGPDSATDFDEAGYFRTLLLADRMDDIIRRHREVMDESDPDQRVALVVDEWGTWFDVEPGTNPGFLYQQNTMRDALVAGLTLNIFHKHAERVRLANLAQLVNVLQAPILTDGPRMLLTPTYHVLEMYKVHQDAQRLPIDVTTPSYSVGEGQLDQLSASASRADDGTVHVSLCNLHHDQTLTVACAMGHASCRTAEARCLSGQQIGAKNTFDQPHTVKPEPLTVEMSQDGRWLVSLPPHSVVVVSLPGG